MKFHPLSNEIYLNTVPAHLMEQAEDYNLAIRDELCERTRRLPGWNKITKLGTEVQRLRSELIKHEFGVAK